MCYTVAMESPQKFWSDWAQILQRWKMGDLVASFLEAIGPLSVLGAQFIYLGQPMLDKITPRDHLRALANMLEDSKETQAFITFLREVKQT